MAEYIKKPVKVEAFKMSEDVYSDDSTWPVWLKNSSDI